MASHSAVEFDKRLWRLFEDRTAGLKKAILQGHSGRLPVISRRKVSHSIEKLQRLASDCIVDRMAKKEFDKVVDKKKQWHSTKNKGWGWRARRDNFDDWFERHIPYPNCIYVFWQGRKCRYVGRTVRGKGRPREHFAKRWCAHVTRVDIYSTSSASQVPKLECLGIHRFEPTENGPRASIPKWAKKCPVCKVHKLIRKEIRLIFRLRG